MPRYPCPKSGKKDIYPSVTEIISDCTNSSGALTQWAANMVVEYLKESCHGCLTEEQKLYLEIFDGGEDGFYHILSDKDLNNARFHFREVSKKALDIGSEVHGMIEQYFKGNIPLKKGVTKEAWTAFKAFLTWKKENDVKAIEVEKTVYSLTKEPCPDCNGEEGFDDCKLCDGAGFVVRGWAGTLDFYGYFNGKLYVIDWKSSKPKNKKTGKGVYKETHYQVAAYRSATSIKLNKHIDGCGVLRLDKETGMPDWNDTSKTYEQDLKVFNDMVTLYFDRHERIAKKFKEATE